MRIAPATASLFLLASLLASLTVLVNADTGGLALPDYATKPLPIASTFYWFSSVEVGVCYSPQARVGSIKGAIHCTHQGKYDIDNNTWTLPQTCVAVKPLGGPLSSAVRDSCTNAKGTFNVIKPAASNTNGAQAFNAIQQQQQQAAPDSGAPDPNDQENGGKKEGLLGGLGSLIGM